MRCSDFGGDDHRFDAHRKHTPSDRRCHRAPGNGPKQEPPARRVPEYQPTAAACDGHGQGGQLSWRIEAAGLVVCELSTQSREPTEGSQSIEASHRRQHAGRRAIEASRQCFTFRVTSICVCPRRPRARELQQADTEFQSQSQRRMRSSVRAISHEHRGQPGSPAGQATGRPRTISQSVAGGLLGQS